MAPFLSTLLLIAAAVPSSFALIWPIPREQSLGTDVAWLSKHARFEVKYAPASNSSITSRYVRHTDGNIRRERTSNRGLAERRIDAAIERTKFYFYKDQFIPWKLNPQNWTSPVRNRRTAVDIKTIRIAQTAPEPDNTKDEEYDESYSLMISTVGKNEATVDISAATSIGVLHALTSLTQLFFLSDGCGDVYTPYLPVTIRDAPKFSHRGLNLDVSRSFYTVFDIKKTLDVLSWNKMNRFHLHITDSQSWPLEIPSMPELTAKGAYRFDQIYTPRDLRELYAHAELLGIKLILEIDMPGHTASIAYSHPELIAAFKQQPWQNYCAQPPCGQLKLASPEVDNFVSKLFKDLLPRLKSSGATYYHAGGDEFNSNALKLDETVGSADPEVIRPILQKFIDKTYKQIFDAGLTVVAWEEMALKWNLTLDSRTIIQAWQETSAVREIAERGFRVIAGSYCLWYLDCGQGQWLDFKPESYAQFYPFADYCSPMKNWKLIYSYDPLAGVPKELHHLVLGGEVHLWSEQADGRILDGRLWPRSSAAAEVLWSGSQDLNGQNRTHVTITPRLAEMRERMVRRGIAASLVTQQWCLQNIGECEL